MSAEVAAQAVTEENYLQDFDQLKADITLFVSPTKDLTVTDAASDLVAMTTLKKVKELQTIIENKRVEKVKPLNDRSKAITAYAKELTGPLVSAEIHIKNARGSFADAEVRRRAEEQRRIEAERKAAEQKAEAERLAREAEAKAKRDAEEKAAREETARKQREIEEKAAAEEAALLLAGAEDSETKRRAEEEAAAAHAQAEAEAHARAEEAERSRLAEEARLMREKAEREKVFRDRQKALEATRPKNIRVDWEFEILDAAAVTRDLCEPVDKLIRAAIAKGLRTAPGLRIYEKTGVIAR